MNKEVFKEAQVGDYVWSSTNGDGEITSVNNLIDFPILCKFDDKIISFSYSGKRFKSEKYSSLFYKKQEPHEVIKRPEPEIDWFKVPINTPVIICNNGKIEQKGHFAMYLPEKLPCYRFMVFDKLSVQINARDASWWKQCKIDEGKTEIKKEWLK